MSIDTHPGFEDANDEVFWLELEKEFRWKLVRYNRRLDAEFALRQNSRGEWDEIALVTAKMRNDILKHVRGGTVVN